MKTTILAATALLLLASCSSEKTPAAPVVAPVVAPVAKTATPTKTAVKAAAKKVAKPAPQKAAPSNENVRSGESVIKTETLVD